MRDDAPSPRFAHPNTIPMPGLGRAAKEAALGQLFISEPHSRGQHKHIQPFAFKEHLISHL
jgi:hypothetical protein